MKILNAISVDVEDYFHVTNLEHVAARGRWDQFESRVVRNTRNLLDLLDERGIRGTFFVLGWVASRFPSLVREIAGRRHEVASHGYDHRLVYEQTPRSFRQEVRHTKSVLEDLVEREVVGYRAPSCSITKDSLWALDILAEEGYRYDSSVFPIRHDRYGIPDADRFPTLRRCGGRGREIVEFPLSTLEALGTRVPVAGGGYLRLLPLGLSRYGIRRLNGRGRPAVVYVHPWEIDPDQPRFPMGVLKRLRCYGNLGKVAERLRCLFREFSFAPVRETLHQEGFEV